MLREVQFCAAIQPSQDQYLMEPNRWLFCLPCWKNYFQLHSKQIVMVQRTNCILSFTWNFYKKTTFSSWFDLKFRILWIRTPPGFEHRSPSWQTITPCMPSLHLDYTELQCTYKINQSKLFQLGPNLLLNQLYMVSYRNSFTNNVCRTPFSRRSNVTQ